jgi:hypothetical protein
MIVKPYCSASRAFGIAARPRSSSVAEREGVPLTLAAPTATGAPLTIRQVGTWWLEVRRWG